MNQAEFESATARLQAVVNGAGPERVYGRPWNEAITPLMHDLAIHLTGERPPPHPRETVSVPRDLLLLVLDQAMADNSDVEYERASSDTDRERHRTERGHIAELYAAALASPDWRAKFRAMHRRAQASEREAIRTHRRLWSLDSVVRHASQRYVAMCGKLHPARRFP